MNRFWTLLFLLVPVLGCATFVVAPYYNIWLPNDVSAHGHAIDGLFYLILGLTGVVFLGTELVLFAFLWRYDERRQKEPVKFTHGSHVLEIVWTILPAVTLLLIAVYQMNAWASEKMQAPDIPPTAEVTGRQFEWRLRYPGTDGELYTPDDIFHVNDLHVPVGEEILLVMKSEDVLHSFFVPNMRVKQDLVPGMRQLVWFKPTEVGTYDIVCAELCGWGHYKMKGQLTVEPRSDYEAWLAKTHAAQQATDLPSPDDES